MVHFEEANRIIQAAMAEATAISQPMCVAVVDYGGNTIAFARMDKAWIGSIDIAHKKAWTARAFDISTKELGENSQPGDQFYGIQESNDGRVMVFAGGLPLVADDEVVGAVGVSGGSGSQDQRVAEAGVAAF